MTIAATLSLEAASQRTWDVVIVGAGPAGALAALLLVRSGLAVLLVDRASFPRSKVCGCCLNQASLTALRIAGLGDLPSRCGARPWHMLHLGSVGRSARVPIGSGVALSRFTFDAALVHAAVAEGVSFLPSSSARLGVIEADTRKVHLRGAENAADVRARIVLAADGLGGAFLSRAGLSEAMPTTTARLGAGAILDVAPEFYGAGSIHMACGASGYVGLVRLEDGRLHVASALDRAAVRASGLAGTVQTILNSVDWPIPPALATADWQGTPPLTRQATHLAAPRVFALGDATGYVEPFTGEGMAWALRSALALSPIVVRAIRGWHQRFEAEWSALHRRVIRQRQWSCRALASLLRRPRLVRLAVDALAWAPRLATPIVWHLNAPPPVPHTS